MSTPTRTATLFGSLVVLVLVVSADVTARPPESRGTADQSALTVDNTTYIDANRILMFVTNHGNFGRDLSGTFGYDYGTFFPFTSVADIRSGVNTSSVLYAGGLWLGGIDSVTKDTLVVVSEYSSEYVPGPMVGGTFQTDRPEFRVYHLYKDSPNEDYYEWPVSQGAPVDGNGDPAMIGDQFLWTVYNDADAAQHDNNNGGTLPLRIEVQQMVWAVDQEGDIEIPASPRLAITPWISPDFKVTGTITDPGALNGHDYAVVTDTLDGSALAWHLIDLTQGDTVLADQTDFSGTSVETPNGFRIQMILLSSPITSFDVVANGSGPLDPPTSGALASQGFPTPGGMDPGDDQQVGPARWAFHTSYYGPSYDDFVLSTFAGRTAMLTGLAQFDWEMRFTGSYDQPGVGGGYAWALYADRNGYWVPFELWRCGQGTPDDPSDDLRLIPWVRGGQFGEDNFIYDLSSYGSASDYTCHYYCEHSASDGGDDPYTDGVHWMVPTDETPGDAGYQEFEDAMIYSPQDWPGLEQPAMYRTVLISLDGGLQPPFAQKLPEQGTVFRMSASLPKVIDTFLFTATLPTPLTPGPLGMTEFLKYRIINKGNRILKDLFVSLWFDPDLGGAGDDLVGCDTLSNSFFCYNADNDDSQYGGQPPAVGIKIIEGPITFSPGDTAMVDGLPRPNYKNLGMYSFNKYINGTDPDNYVESYQYMLGLDPKNGGIPYINPTNGQPTRFVMSGDPVAGTGWLDQYPDDRRMMSSFGPFTFRPGDTQQVVFKLAVGQGANRLSSITSLRQILEYSEIPTVVDDDQPEVLPREFTVHQNYPNPFNAATVIKYSLPARSDVEVTVFNVLGQRVATLVSESQAAGEHPVVWNGTDALGYAVASGVYFYRVRAGEDVQIRKMMLLK